MLRVNLMVCRKCQQVFSLTAGVECPMCRSPLYMSVFVEEAAQHSSQQIGLDVYTDKELAEELVKRGYEGKLTPRR